MYKSLAHFVSLLEAEGELCRVKCRVATELEIAEITDRISKTEGGGKALLFENTGTDYPVLTNMMGSDKRIAMALGVDNLDSLTERIDALLGELTTPAVGLWDKLKMLPLLADMSRWFPKRKKGRGECQSICFTGDDVDLNKLPILKCWPCDGGRFITLPMVNTLDPVSGVRNVGMYRMQQLDSRTTGMHWHIHKTGARHYEGYRKLRQRMPVTVTLGGDPAYTYAATAPMPDNMDEYLLAGFLRKRPVELVKSLMSDIWIPADCDFVIEGYVDTSEQKVVEGPFGDHTGFYSLEDLYPKFHVTAITQRRDAIYPATIVGVPPQEDAYIAKATERIFLAPIRLALQPEVCDLWMPEEGTAHNIAVASVECRYPGQARKVAQGLWGAGQMMFNKYLVLTPSGCDVRSIEQLSELMRRVDLSKSVHFDSGIYDVLDHATATQGFGSKMLFDLTVVDVSEPVEKPSLPKTFTPTGGVWLVNSSLVDRWSLLLLYAERSRPDEVDVERYLKENSISGVKYVALFDYAAAGSMTERDLLWLAAANTDPKRDIKLCGSTIIIDARSKRPGIEGNPKRFPNVVTSIPDTIHLVDSRWQEYGLGEQVESPSRRYRKLWLSDRAEW